MVGVGRESEGSCGERGEGVAKDRERLATLQPVGVIAGGEFREAGEAIGNTLDGAKPGRSRADGGQKSGEDSGGGFVAPVAEETGEAHAEDGAVEPRIAFGAIGHEEELYSRQPTANSLKSTIVPESNEKLRRQLLEGADEDLSQFLREKVADCQEEF